MTVTIVHDYLTQRGGAERVVLSMHRAFPEAPIYTSLYAPESTFSEFRDADVRTLGLNRFSLFRRHHRTAFPFLAQAFSGLTIDDSVVLCSSSGWAHGVHCTGRKIVYCYTPARWIYQSSRYAGDRQGMKVVALASRRLLQRWDQRAASTADQYLAISTVVRERIQHAYHRDAEILPPPPTVDASGSQDQVPGLSPGFFLCVARLLPYKKVDAVVSAFGSLTEERLVVAGSGPDESKLRALAPPNVSFLGRVPESQLRWLYANCQGVVSSSYEDYGLTPLEGATFGKPSAVLRWGGFLDTVVEGVTGVFFDEPDGALIAQAIRRLATEPFDPDELRRRAAEVSEDNFIRRLRAVVLGPHLEPGADELSDPATR